MDISHFFKLSVSVNLQLGESNPTNEYSTGRFKTPRHAPITPLERNNRSWYFVESY